MPRWAFVGTTKALQKELNTWPLTLPLRVYLEITRHAQPWHPPSAPNELNAPQT